MRAYDRVYLEDAMNLLGEAVDYAAHDCGIPAEVFLEHFQMDSLSDLFARGGSRVLSGMTGVELVYEVVTKCGAGYPLPPPKPTYSISREYWLGWILAYTQWTLNRSFRAIFRVLSPQEILQRYPALHEASEEKCVDCFRQLIRSKNLPSQLSVQRKICSLTQKELAERAGVNLRTLQQYESKAKELSKASVRTVLNLANALFCSVDDILDVEV